MGMFSYVKEKYEQTEYKMSSLVKLCKVCKKLNVSSDEGCKRSKR